MKKIIVLRIATVKNLNLRADCQGVIPVVANRGTLESGLPRVIPVVANGGIGARFATQSEIQYQLFYIDSHYARGTVSY
jgi:hypothetical protein